MNHRQIECFLETGKHLNFTKAAQNLYLPQPAVSRYISALENELGVALFQRENSRHISLTDEGILYFNFFQLQIFYSIFIVNHIINSIRNYIC